MKPISVRKKMISLMLTMITMTDEQFLTQENLIKSLKPNVPGLVRPSQVSQHVYPPNKKPSHCKKCAHIVKGHKRARNEAVGCPLCPHGICTEGGGQIVCTSEWDVPMPLSTDNHPANPVLISDNMTVYSFPYSQSQATLSPS